MTQSSRFRFWFWLIRIIGVIVPRRLRADWKQEWDAELRHRESLLADWDKLNWRTKLDLLRRSLGAFWDALLLQPRRLEDEMFQDLRYGFRMLLKTPGFTAVAMLSLALGIGANTAIFSLVDAVLLKSLPVNSPEQLVELDSFNQRGEQRNLSLPFFQQLRTATPHFSGVFAATDGNDRIEMRSPESSGQTETAEVQLVSGEYFQVLGVAAAIGRLITLADDQTPGAHPVAVLSYNFWKSRFAGDASTVGKIITLKEQPFTIIGVAASGFFGEAVGRAPDIWAPLMMHPQLYRGTRHLTDANTGWLRLMARLETGASREQAQASLTAVLGQLQSDGSDLGKSARIISTIQVLPGRQGLAQLRNRFSKPLTILMTVVVLVLLIACANVANLLLARATARQKEVAVRLAIGARRLRLVRQFLTESLLLAVAGGAVGLFFAWWGGRILLRLASDDGTPFPIALEPNLRILTFTVVVSLMTTVLFGLMPALVVTRQDVNTVLKGTVSRPRLLLSRPLIVAQVALSLLLVTGAGLFVQTLHNLRTLNLGFAAESILQARINPQASGYKQAQLPDLYRRLVERLNAVPGVGSVSLAGTGFRTGTSRTCCIAVEGYTHEASEDREIQTISVTPGYFETMDLPLLSGRDFAPQEVSNAKVAIINESMARRFFGQADAVGRRIGWGDPAKSVKYDIEIVGVVRNANYGNLRAQTRSLIYFPSQGGTLLVVRSTVGAALPALIRQEIHAVDNSLEILSIGTVPQLLDQALVQEQLLAKLSSFFGLLALLLACIGLYGVMSYDVARRTREIGIRMALGARALDVMGMMLGQTLRLVAIGVGIGLSLALAATRLIESLLFGLTPNDPITLILSSLLLITVAALAGWLPARRAARVEPMIALRHE